jgi:hypothetical protein
MTHTQIRKSDIISEEVYGNISQGPRDIRNNRYYGISMGCPIGYHNASNNNMKIYRVDTGVSRSQDNLLYNFNNPTNLHKVKNRDDEKDILFGRTPQVLKILNDEYSIIRSKMKNTRIHQLRQSYEDNARRIVQPTDPSQSLLIDDPNDPYYSKYMKYKQKYLKLKYTKN